jgi:hypothetical protein
MTGATMVDDGDGGRRAHTAVDLRRPLSAFIAVC